MTSLQLLRIGLVRFAASFLIILTTGILNRLVIAEFGVSALLATVVFSFQHFSSPLALWSGHVSDRRPIGGRRRTPYILGWTVLAAATVPAMPDLLSSLNDSGLAIVASTILMAIMGFGLKAANLLVSALIVDVNPDAEVRGRQLNLVWTMAIVGFVMAGLVFGWVIPDFQPDASTSLDRLRWVATLTAIGVVLVTLLGVAGAEKPAPKDLAPPAQGRLRDSLRLAAQDPSVRRLLAFVAVSDFAFFIQEFILEPFGAEAFDLPVSVTTSFNITFGAGMVLAMIASGGLGILQGHFPARRVLIWANTLGSASFVVLAASGMSPSALIPVVAVFFLGAAKGLYNTALSHRLTTIARPAVAGMVLGAWGAVGGFAMALGGLAGGALVDGARALGAGTVSSYGIAFAVEACLLLVALPLLGGRLEPPPQGR